MNGSDRIRRGSALGALLGLAFLNGPAVAQDALIRTAPAAGRIYAPDKPCGVVRDFVARVGSAIVAQSNFVYERVYRDAGACQFEVTSAPAYTPSLDERYCFAGYRCKDRNGNDNAR